MKIRKIPVGMLQENCYFVSDENGETAVIDPGDEAGRLLGLLQSGGLTPRCILLSHGHFDHVGAVAALAERYHCPVYLHEADRALPARLTGGPLPQTRALHEGDELAVGALRFRVLETPGHSAGSVSLLCSDALFSGDTIFAGGSWGRTDFPGGSEPAISASLRRLASLPPQTRVFPGHGPETTIAAERACDPFMMK